MRCPTCGHIDGHDRLTHRNQLLADWWPLYRIRTGKRGGHRLAVDNLGSDVPRSFVEMAEKVVSRSIGQDCPPGVM